MQADVHSILRPACPAGLLTPLAGKLHAIADLDEHMQRQQLERKQDRRHKQAMRRYELSPERPGGRTPYEVNPLANFCAHSGAEAASRTKQQRQQLERSPPRPAALAGLVPGASAQLAQPHYNPFVQPHSGPGHVRRSSFRQHRPASSRAMIPDAFGRQAQSPTDQQWRHALAQIQRLLVDPEALSDDRRFAERLEVALDEHVAGSAGVKAEQLLQLIYMLRAGSSAAQVHHRAKAPAACMRRTTLHCLVLARTVWKLHLHHTCDARLGHFKHTCRQPQLGALCNSVCTWQPATSPRATRSCPELSWRPYAG